MYQRDESGYGSADSMTESNPPLPNLTRIKGDAIRFEEDFEVTDLMMNSANGVLYKGRCLRTGNEVIFKQLPRTSVPSWAYLDGCLVPAEIAYHFKTYRISKSAGVICQPITWLEKRSSFVIVLEKLENCCDLFELSRKYGALAEDPVKIIFQQLINIWGALNDAKVCHRDLKDENIIINLGNLECRLIDFGCATELSDKPRKSFAGTPEFYPPEWFKMGSFHHQNLNAWSLGVILFILLTGNMPAQIQKNLMDFDINQDAADILPLLSSPAQKLLKSLLNPMPNERATIETTQQLMQHWNRS